MSDAPLSIDPEALLKESSWLHGLARSLVHDEHEAEDVVQATFLKAVTHPPRSAITLPAWLGRVARRMAIRTSRRKQSRARREQVAARPEACPPTVDVVARTSLFRQLTGFVLELEEPYRTTVLLRYFEDVPVRELAARQGVPVPTVKTRLRRAIAQLRARLDRDAGGSEAWRVALAIPAGSVAATGAKAAVATGAVIMATKAKAALAAAAVLVACLIVWRAFRDAQSDASSTRVGGGSWVATSPAPDQPPSPEARGLISPKRYEEPESRAQSQAAASPLLTRGARVSGRVLTADGRQPVAAELFFHHIGDDYKSTLWRKSTATGATRADGTFELPGRVAPFEETGQVLALHEHGLDWVGFGVLPDTAEVQGLEILARPGWTLAVRVVDEQGHGIPGATILVVPRFGPLGGPFAAWADAPSSRPAEGALGRLEARFRKTTGSDGNARFEALPEPRLDPDEIYPSGLTDVYAFKEGLDPGKGSIEKIQPSLRTEIVLSPHRAVVVSGTVRRADDRPIPGAKLTLAGEAPVFSDGAGTYRIATDRPPHNSVQLDCSAVGFSTAIDHLPIEPGKDQQFDFKLLEAVPITGRVLDENGAPVTGTVSVSSNAGPRLAGDAGGRIRPDGTFSFQGANTEPIWLVDVAPDEAWELPRRRWVRGGEHLEIVCARAVPGSATVEAQIVDAMTGDPIDPLLVQLMSRATFPGERNSGPEPRTARGLVRAEKVPPGPWRLWIHTAQFHRIQHDFTVGPADQLVRLRIELGKPAAIVARVVLDDVPEAIRPQSLLVTVEDWNGVAVSAPGKPSFERHPGTSIVDGAKAWTARFEMVPPGVPVKILVEQYYDPNRKHLLVGGEIVKLAPGEERTIEIRPMVAGTVQFTLSKPVTAGLAYWHRERDGTWIEDYRYERDASSGVVVPSTRYIRPGPLHWRVELWPLEVPPRLRTPKVVEGEATIETGKVTAVTVEVP